jgi:hypothetical protein
MVLQVGHDLAGKTPVVADLLDAKSAGQIDDFSFDEGKTRSITLWMDPPELKARTISWVRGFLKAHLLMTAAR